MYLFLSKKCLKIASLENFHQPSPTVHSKTTRFKILNNNYLCQISLCFHRLGRKDKHKHKKLFFFYFLFLIFFDLCICYDYVG
ncbi:MAG: hypothetical protein FD155_92 [Bacteroidetes bacterium]|nr:MAG: hypothetical protein FD155_92 [Bacteroidota bacterium]